MATADTMTATQEIGETAGVIWRLLDQDGPTRITQLIKEVDAPRDMVMQAIGWLAREEKIRIDESSRSRFIELA